MTPSAEQRFADEVGVWFQGLGVQRMAGRILGWLLICDPPAQTAAEIAEALQASRSAVGTAAELLEKAALVRRTRAPGDRADRISVNPNAAEQGLDSPAEYAALRALAAQGLEVLADAPPARRRRLLEMAAFHDFLIERLPALAAEWRARREALLASGELPDDPTSP